MIPTFYLLAKKIVLISQRLFLWRMEIIVNTNIFDNIPTVLHNVFEMFVNLESETTYWLFWTIFQTLLKWEYETTYWQISAMEFICQIFGMHHIYRMIISTRWINLTCGTIIDRYTLWNNMSTCSPIIW